MPVARSPLLLALALTGGGDVGRTTIRATPNGDDEYPSTIVIDDAGAVDDSVSGIHSEVRVVRQADGTFRAASATWGYICYRRPSPPYSTELCP